LLARYRFTVASINPFVSSGLSLRPAGTGTGLSHHGITAGAGLEMRVRGVNISPTLRYKRWAEPRNNFGLPPARPDQLGFLVGFDRSSASSPVAGAMVEFGLPKNLFVEVDGLYRPLHATDVPTDGSGEGRRVRFATLTWEFPVLSKYKLPTPKARPFIELGPSFRAFGNLQSAPPSHYGVTAGTGIEMSLGRLKIAPAFRFTRWARDRMFQNPDFAHAFPNQAQVLVGVYF